MKNKLLLLTLFGFLTISLNSKAAQSYEAECVDFESKFTSCEVSVSGKYFQVKSKEDPNLNKKIHGGNIHHIHKAKDGRSIVRSQLDQNRFKFMNTFGVGRSHEYIAVMHLYGKAKSKGVYFKMKKKLAKEFLPKLFKIAEEDIRIK
jgi:hypothetical protein